MHRILLTALILSVALAAGIAGCDYQDGGGAATNGDSSTDVAATEPHEPEKKPLVIGGPELSTHQAQIVAGQDGAADRLAFDYFLFTPPQGWAVRGTRDNEVLRIFDKGDIADPDARITVYRRRANSPNVADNARAYAADWNGEVQDLRISLGNTEARLISREHSGDGLQIVQAVLCRWMVEDFIIQGEAKPGVDVRQDVLDLANGWAWMGPG